jgi:hypothetical protein
MHKYLVIIFEDGIYLKVLQIFQFLEACFVVLEVLVNV